MAAATTMKELTYQLTEANMKATMRMLTIDHVRAARNNAKRIRATANKWWARWEGRYNFSVNYTLTWYVPNSYGYAAEGTVFHSDGHTASVRRTTISSRAGAERNLIIRRIVRIPLETPYGVIKDLATRLVRLETNVDIMVGDSNIPRVEIRGGVAYWA